MLLLVRRPNILRQRSILSPPYPRYYVNIDKVALQTRMKKGDLTLVDVRTPGEIKTEGELAVAHVKAVNIPLGDIESGAFELSDEAFEKKYGVKKFKPSDELAFSCKAGRRSTIASTIAEKHGYQHVYNYAKGAEDWFGKKFTH